MSELEFPFAQVSDVDEVFGGIPNYDEVLKACPQEFYKNDNVFVGLASKMVHGTFNPNKDLLPYDLRADTEDEAVAQRKYLNTWLTSFKPKHEDKMAVAGWILSLMLQEKISS